MPPSLIDQFRLLARNNAWSNTRLSRACAELSPEAFAAPRVSFFPSLCQTLQHILFVDRRYLADLTGLGRAAVSRAELPDTAAALGVPAQNRPAADRPLRRLGISIPHDRAG